MAFFLIVSCACNRDNRPPGGQPPLAVKPPAQTTPPPKAGDGRQYMPGEVVVKLIDGVDPGNIDALSRELGLELIEPMPMAGTYLMRITGGDTVESMVKMLNAYKVVDYAEPNFTAETN